MLRTLSLVAVLVVICGATHIQYPVSGQPCILMDVQSDNTLVWTDKDKKQTPVPRWNLNSSTVNSGGCDPNPYVTVRWPDDASFTFTFSKSATMVNLEMAFSIIPNHIAEFNKSTDGERLIAKKSMMLGSDMKAFVCDEMDPIELIMPGKNGNVYTATINFKSFKAQGFNVVNGQYSEAEECDDTKSTIQTGKPMTEQTPEPQTTEHKPSEPPATTVKTTEHTTKHTTEHTTEHTTKQTTKHTTEHTTEHTTKHTTEHTTEPPTTKPVPSTKAPIVPGNHPSVTVKLDANGVNCFYMVGEILFTVPYTKMDNTNTTVGVGLQDINRVSGTCNGTNHTNIVNIQFLDDWMLDITVSTDGSTLLTDDSDKSFWISELKLNYTYRADIMKDLNASMVNKRAIASAEGTLFKASRQSSYLCNANTGTSMSNGVSLNTYNFQYDAFSTSKNQTKFDGDPTQCSADEKTNSIVPIAVGAALAGLVVIVLIAYLIGRRRNRKGYESV